MPFEVGQFVSDYEILGVLGKGGMGAVYRVRNVISNRVEAMKVLLADVGAQADLGDRFISEIRTLARLDHPNIAKFHTAFKTENQLVMVMEFVEGFTLTDVARQGEVPVQQVLSYVSQTLSALTCAHENGVIHRDIKPSNIMVTPHGIVKLMDFGIAKSNVDPSLTRPGTTMGSMLYMSPEQVRGTNVDARSDLYSLGIVLYELTAGKRPFEAENTFAILDAQLNAPPRPPIELNPQLPQALNEIVLMAIEKDPMRRFQSATAFQSALESVRKRPSSVPAATLPVRGGLERDLAETIPGPTPYAHSIVEPSTGSGGAQPSSQLSSQASSQPRGQQAFSSTPQSQRFETPSDSMPPMPPKKGNRALWMAAGAIACVCVLAAAVYTLPNMLKSSANSKTDGGRAAALGTKKENTPSAIAPVAVDSTLAGANPATAKQVNIVVPGVQPAVKVALQQSAKQVSSTPSTVRPQSEAGQASQTTTASQTAVVLPGPQTAQQAGGSANVSQEEMDKAGEELMKLRARAEAIKGSLNTLRSQQASQGVGLRPDMAAASSRMDSYLQASDSALQSGRIAFARKNMEHADEEITKIEAMFGR